jgi:hypothetical protein
LATARAQEGANEQLTRFNNIFETFTGKFNEAQSSPNPEYACAIKLLKDDGAAIGLSVQERFEIGKWLGKVPKDVTFYVNNDEEVRMLWLKSTLSEIQARGLTNQ